LTQEEPFAQYQSFDKFKDAVCIRHERPEIPADCVPSLRQPLRLSVLTSARNLIQRCWDPDPNKRPPFTEIINELDFIIVDCAISDPLGREFWKTSFLKKVQRARDFDSTLLSRKKYCGQSLW
jgi:hypothetical protein